METQSKSGLSALVFPWYYGAKVQNFGSALLWFGHLNTVVSPFMSPLPVQAFRELFDLAEERNSELLPLFRATAHFAFRMSNESISAFSKASEGLEDRISRIAMVSPGGINHYEKLRDDFAPAVARALRMHDEESIRIACAQFVWRCYEYCLETDQKPGMALDILEAHEKIVDGNSLLLAECLVNHYAPWSQSPSSLVTDSASTIDLLSRLLAGTPAAKELQTMRPPPKWGRDMLACGIFERTLANTCPPLTSVTTPFYIKVFNKNAQALACVKRKCYLAADSLMEKAAKSEVFDMAFEDTIEGMRAEVQEIAELDERAWSNFVGKVLEEEVAWAGGAGLIAAIAAGMPIAVAAAAMTLLGVVGAKAVSQHRDTATKLRESEWCFVYELRRRR